MCFELQITLPGGIPTPPPHTHTHTHTHTTHTQHTHTHTHTHTHKSTHMHGQRTDRADCEYYCRQIWKLRPNDGFSNRPPRFSLSSLSPRLVLVNKHIFRVPDDNNVAKIINAGYLSAYYHATIAKMATDYLERQQIKIAVSTLPAVFMRDPRKRKSFW